MWKCCITLALSILVIILTVHDVDSMIVEKLDGPVTANEMKAFKDFIKNIPLPKNNIRNEMVYGRSGTATNGMGLMYEVSGDIEILDRMIVFADHMLHERNDPKTGRVLWTGKREQL